MNSNQNPEQRARNRIDEQLRASGWVVQSLAGLDPSAARGVAVREYPTDTGPMDYLLLVDGEAVGLVEARQESAIGGPCRETPPCLGKASGSGVSDGEGEMAGSLSQEFSLLSHKLSALSQKSMSLSTESGRLSTESGRLSTEFGRLSTESASLPTESGRLIQGVPLPETQRRRIERLEHRGRNASGRRLRHEQR